MPAVTVAADACPILRWLDPAGAERSGSLFALFAALARGDVSSLPSLRPHQREPFHAFAVQVAAAAQVAAGFPPLPDDEDGWQALLLALTPDWPGGEAWSLVVEDWSRPALLQPPLLRDTDRTDYKNVAATPDALDMLVTSRNHDLKAARMDGAADEDWFFSLLTLQTTEGFLGAGNYGISRMNGGFASRMVFGLRPASGMAAAWRRDVSVLAEDARSRPDRPGGLALLWLPPWDGTVQLSFSALDELYVDICRRVRLCRIPGGGLHALTAGSKVARVAAAALNGRTGDPWAPLKGDGSASVTPRPEHFGYRRFVELLDQKTMVRPLLAKPTATDPETDMTLVAAALVRGQGKTEGLHRRTIPFSRTVFRKLRGDVFLDRVGEVAAGRADDAGEAGHRLKRALFTLYQGGPDKVRGDDKASDAKARAPLADFNLQVDRVFFDDAFWAEVAREAEAPRRAWRNRLRDIASAVFEDAADAAPRTAERRVRARAVARNVLDGSLNRFVKETADGA